jgi:Domain of unknown function (DUF1911)
MTEAAFRAKRRQKFLTEKYFGLNDAELVAGIPIQLEGRDRVRREGVVDSASEAGIFKDKLKLFRLHYTAGEPIESLKSLYADAMHWFGEWHRAESAYLQYLAAKRGEDLRLDVSPIEFEDLFHFQLAIDAVSLGILLGEGNIVRQVAVWMQSNRGADMMIEALLEPVVADPRDVETFYHVEPYDPLLDAIYTAETPAQAAAYVKKYLDGWYKAFEGVPWHNGHLMQTPEYSNYEGYWAFEAAAVCVIHGIDDSTFRDHLVYPKDLADWAREHGVLDQIRYSDAAKNEAKSSLRCEAGKPCLRSGWWSTPAKAGSRRRFEQGEVMPELGGDYGVTIWHWDDLQ